MTEQVKQFTDRWMNTWIRAWEGESKEDVERWVATFTPDAVVRDTPFSKNRGHDSIRKYFEIILTQKDGKGGYKVLAVEGNRGIARWWISYTVMPKKDWHPKLTSLANSFVAIGLDPEKDNQLSQDGIAVLDFDEQGLVTEFSEWWHTHRI